MVAPLIGVPLSDHWFPVEEELVKTALVPVQKLFAPLITGVEGVGFTETTKVELVARHPEPLVTKTE